MRKVPVGYSTSSISLPVLNIGYHPYSVFRKGGQTIHECHEQAPGLTFYPASVSTWVITPNRGCPGEARGVTSGSDYPTQEFDTPDAVSPEFNMGYHPLPVVSKGGVRIPS